MLDTWTWLGYIRCMDSINHSKAQAMVTIGARVVVTVFSSGRMESYFGTVLSLGGVATARVQIEGDRIIGVFQSQIKAI